MSHRLEEHGLYFFGCLLQLLDPRDVIEDYDHLVLIDKLSLDEQILLRSVWWGRMGLMIGRRKLTCALDPTRLEAFTVILLEEIVLIGKVLTELGSNEVQ
jgi:hypothetical protein